MLPACIGVSAVSGAPSTSAGNSAIAPVPHHTSRLVYHDFPRTVNRRPRRHRRGCYVPVRATTGDELFQGMYGPWKVEPEDELEVLVYRAGLSVGAVSFALGAVISFVPESWGIYDSFSGLLNPLCIAGAAGLGVSYFLIHIYVTPLKRLLQALWAVGVAGGLFLMINHSEPLPTYVAQNPAAVWAVGPFFAAVTGLAFKEGLCYGSLEAGLLFVLTPALLLGHLSGALPENVLHGMLGALAIVFGVFAVRKYSQAVKDDIGDKSVFEFQKLAPDEQLAVLRRLKGQELEE